MSYKRFVKHSFSGPELHKRKYEEKEELKKTSIRYFVPDEPEDDLPLPKITRDKSREG